MGAYADDQLLHGVHGLVVDLGDEILGSQSCLGSWPLSIDRGELNT
jgi:hypothetical protein